MGIVTVYWPLLKVEELVTVVHAAVGERFVEVSST
jgi:hypothetical protein